MEGTWEELETQLKKRTSHGNCITYLKVEEEYKNEDDSPDFNGTKVYFNTSNDSIQKTYIYIYIFFL